MTVLRIKKTENFVTIHTGALNNPNLSFQAKGLWAYCMSRPNDWSFHVSHLATVSKGKEDRVYSAIKELEEHGYIKKIQNNENGRFGSVDYEVYETPELKKSLPQTVFPRAEFPRTENPALVNIDTLHKIEEVNNMSEVQAPADVLASPPPKEYPKEAKEISKEIFSKAKEIYPKVKVPKFSEWERILDLINRIDGKSWDEIREMLKWAWESDFWVKQIRSPESLRKHWDKMAIQRSSYSNLAITVKRNRMIAQEVKHFLNKTERGNLLWIGDTRITNKENEESISLDVPSETIDLILRKWFKLKKV